jgi:phospholipid/cholesterol/gamma-HCH transport system permease protein
MASAGEHQGGLLVSLGDSVVSLFDSLGDFTLFAIGTLGWLVRRPPSSRNFLPICYGIGVRSVPVVAVTGMFIGMVMAVQFYQEFKHLNLQTSMGSVITISIVRELGPVLAATMLAGRVGSAMAAELATMRITEQVDALASMGAHPLAYLVAPRLLASVLLIPLLSVLADFMGIMGGAFICTRYFDVESHYYWEHTQKFVGLWDIFTGLAKSSAFAVLIALIACHRGLNSRAGAEGVGQAATEAFVTSFIVILAMDLFLGIFLLEVYNRLWGSAGPSLL